MAENTEAQVSGTNSTAINQGLAAIGKYLGIDTSDASRLKDRAQKVAETGKDMYDRYHNIKQESGSMAALEDLANYGFNLTNDNAANDEELLTDYKDVDKTSNSNETQTKEVEHANSNKSYWISEIAPINSDPSEFDSFEKVNAFYAANPEREFETLLTKIVLSGKEADSVMKKAVIVDSAVNLYYHPFYGFITLETKGRWVRGDLVIITSIAVGYYK